MKNATLIAVLRMMDRHYFNKTPIASDALYDRMRERARKADPSNPYFKEVGAAPESRVSVDLPIPMNGLTKIRPSSAANWASEYSPTWVYMTHKLDGLACLLYYCDGIFQKAYTRGTSTKGQDITRHAKMFVPKVLDYSAHSADTLKVPNPRRGDVLIRGELVIRIPDWQKYGKDFKHPRNMVGALINRKEPSPLLKHVHFVAHELSFPATGDPEVDMAAFHLYGLESTYSVKRSMADINADALKSYIDMIKRPWPAGSVYPLDGVVLAVHGGRSNNDIPAIAKVAVKLDTHDQPYVTTRVRRVEWVMSDRGLMKPTIHIKPVTIDGITISTVTGNNAREIEEFRVGSGSKVRIVRAGDVIPHMLKDDNNRPTPANDWSLPSKCPSCGSKLHYTMTANGKPGADLICHDQKCRTNRQTKTFWTRMNPDGLGESIIAEISNGNSVHATLRMKAETLQEMFGAVKGKQVKRALLKSMECPLAKVMYASGLFTTGTQSLGVETISTFLSDAAKHGFAISEFHDEAAAATRYVDRLRSLYPLSNKLAIFLNGLREFRHFYSTIQKWHKEPDRGDSLSGMVFCFTGFRDPALLDVIRNNGGGYRDSVTSQVTHLIHADHSEPHATKLGKAKKLGVKVWNQTRLMRKLGLWKTPEEKRKT